MHTYIVGGEKHSNFNDSGTGKKVQHVYIVGTRSCIYRLVDGTITMKEVVSLRSPGSVQNEEAIGGETLTWEGREQNERTVTQNILISRFRGPSYTSATKIPESL